MKMTTNINDAQAKGHVFDGVVIVPDIHQRLFRLHEIDRKFPRSTFPKRVYLGDWFDSFNAKLRTPNATDQLIQYLSIEAKNPDSVLLWGNHDWHYHRVDCLSSGFQPEVYQILMAHFPNFHTWFKHYHEAHGWMMSHAGFNYSEQHLGDLDHDACMVGAIRGGTAPYGGHLWLDWNHEWNPSPSQRHQIVGHTVQLKGPAVRPGGVNLDTASQHVGLLSDAGLTIMALDSLDRSS